MPDGTFTGKTFNPKNARRPVFRQNIQSKKCQTANSLATSQTDSERTTKQAQFIFCGRLMIDPFSYLVGWWLKFQVAIPFRGREQRVRIDQTLLESHFSEHPCSFQPSKSSVVNVGLRQILRSKVGEKTTHRVVSCPGKSSI
jgi:hypothetical protein